MSKKDGGPAFPESETVMGGVNGMTLRDYFAAKAMVAYLHIGDRPNLPSRAYGMADAMLKERAK